MSEDKMKLAAQYKPNISVFIRDTVSIKENKIHEGDLYEAEHRFN
jgi:hypothetical protein